jgi:hypothetical protein
MNGTIEAKTKRLQSWHSASGRSGAVRQLRRGVAAGPLALPKWDASGHRPQTRYLGRLEKELDADARRDAAYIAALGPLAVLGCIWVHSTEMPRELEVIFKVTDHIGAVDIRVELGKSSDHSHWGRCRSARFAYSGNAVTGL